MALLCFMDGYSYKNFLDIIRHFFEVDFDNFIIALAGPGEIIRNWVKNPVLLGRL
jgi:hypothetical protein